jgi:hypothetical protein
MKKFLINMTVAMSGLMALCALPAMAQSATDPSHSGAANTNGDASNSDQSPTHSAHATRHRKHHASGSTQGASAEPSGNTAAQGQPDQTAGSNRTDAQSNAYGTMGSSKSAGSNMGSTGGTSRQ